MKGNNLADLQGELAQIEPSRKANLSKVWGDLVNKTKVMTAPQASEVNSLAPEPPQPSSGSSSAKKPETTKMEEIPQPISEKGIEDVVLADDPQEFDLDNPEHAERYILSHFSEKVREEAVLPVQYYIKGKKNQASKKGTSESHFAERIAANQHAGEASWSQAILGGLEEEPCHSLCQQAPLR